MTQVIGSLQVPHIEHGILVDLVIPTQVVIEYVQGFGGVVTATFTDPGFVPFEPGTTIVVNGITPTNYNGTFTVLACSETQVTWSDDATDTYVEGGSIKGKDRRWYLSNCYNPVVYNGKTYIAAGGLLNLSDIQQDLVNTNAEINLSLSAIPPEYIENIIGQQIKGGVIRIYRVFFDPTTKEIQTIEGVRQVFQRFNGIITNWSIDEQVDNNASGTASEIAYTITLACSSLVGILENKVVGRRTNNSNYQTYYAEPYITQAITTDKSFSRIEQLKSATFDFGKPIK